MRNAVDQGIEEPDEPLAAGKPARAILRLDARVQPDAIVLEIKDDGRGVDWERVASKARARGLPSETREDLVAALFMDGFSTRDEASEISGRGIGLAAARAACLALGARLAVQSRFGHGTTFVFSVPTTARTPSQRPLSRAAA